MKGRQPQLQSGRLFDKVYFPAMSICASFLIAGIVFALLGFDPVTAFGGLLSGSWAA